jgi:hypothetical protein
MNPPRDELHDGQMLDHHPFLFRREKITWSG